MEAVMALEQRIESLRKRHAAIDTQILAESARLSSSDDVLKQLKREKLMVKEELSRLTEDRQRAA